MYRILLADYKHVDSSGPLPGLFKRAGCHVEVFCDTNSWLLKNKSFDLWHPLLGRKSETFATQLQQLLRENVYDWVVLADDVALRIVKSQVTDLKLLQKILPLTSPENYDLIGTKSGLSTLCQKYGITTPRFAIYDGVSDPQLCVRTLSFPIVLKVDESSGGKGVFLVSNAADLLPIFAAIPKQLRKNIVFQEYIKGEILSVEAICRTGILLGFASSRVLGTVSGEYSQSRVREYKVFPELEVEVKNIATAFGLHGFVSLTFMYDINTKQFNLIEADARPNIWFHLTSFCGVDFVQVIKTFLNPVDDNRVMRNNDKSVTLRYVGRDIKWAISQGNFWELGCWMFKKEGYREFISDLDPKFLQGICAEIGRYCLYGIYQWKPVTFLRNLGKRILSTNNFHS